MISFNHEDGNCPYVSRIGYVDTERTTKENLSCFVVLVVFVVKGIHV